MTEQLFNEATRWQEETFPRATALSKAHHLKKEVKELIVSIETSDPNRRLEYADCFLLIFGSAKANGMSYEDICNAIKEKLEICKNRKWGEPDENGVQEHI